MVAQKSEIAQIVDLAYQETKGEGARRLKVHTSHYYSGLSRNAIQKKLNVMKKPPKLYKYIMSVIDILVDLYSCVLYKQKSQAK